MSYTREQIEEVLNHLDEESQDGGTTVTSAEIVAEGVDMLRQLLAEKDALREVVMVYLESQDALDNREYQEINVESYDALMRRRNKARDDLDAALDEVRKPPADTAAH